MRDMHQDVPDETVTPYDQFNSKHRCAKWHFRVEAWLGPQEFTPNPVAALVILMVLVPLLVAIWWRYG